MNNKNGLFAFSLIELSIVVLIIGILIAGVTQGSRLVRQSRIKTAQNLTSGSPVSSIPNLALWLEPVMDGSIISVANSSNPEDNDLVSAWNDINPQTQNKINLTQATTANQPRYVANGINQLPTLSFNGSSSYLFNAVAGPLSLGDVTYTVIAVVQTRDSGAGGWQHITSQGSCNSTGALADINLKPTLNVGPSFSSCGVNYQPNSYIQNKSYIIIVTVNNTSLQFYSNSIAGTAGTLPGVNLGPDAINAYVGTRNNTGGPEFFNGYISEVIFYDRILKKSEVSSINSYLSTKYAITLN